MENEIMEMEVIEDSVVADENTGMGTGVAMLIGAGITGAVIAGVKLVKWCINAAKAKKESQQKTEQHDFCVEPDVESK